VLVWAVRAGVVTCREAQVIGRSRLGGVSMTALAVERGMSRRHLYRYREEAEQRLAVFLREAQHYLVAPPQQMISGGRPGAAARL
jgi:hypothetical protein